MPPVSCPISKCCRTFPRVPKTTRRSPWRLTCCAASPPTRLFRRTHSRSARRADATKRSLPAQSVMTRSPMPARLTAFLILYLCVVGGQSRADEPICLDAPTGACLGILAAQHAKALVRSENWRAIIQDLVLAGRAGDAKALAGNLSDAGRTPLAVRSLLPWHK